MRISFPILGSVLVAGVLALGGQWCDDDHASPGAGVVEPAHQAPDPQAASLRFVRFDQSPQASLYELHCHNLGLAHPRVSPVALLASGTNKDDGPFKGPSFSASPVIAHDAMRVASLRIYEGPPALTHERIPRSSLFLSTSRLLL